MPASDRRRTSLYRLLAPLAFALVAALIGFLGGRQYQRSLGADPALQVPGMRDYEALALFNHYSIVRANGASMQPTLARWNFLLVRDTRKIARGDILISGHHGMHRVLGLPGDAVWLIQGRVRVCTPRPDATPLVRVGQDKIHPAISCRFLDEPYVRYPPARIHDQGPMLARGGYVTVPDNRRCCQSLYFVPADDVIGVEVGSLLSYGPLGPAGLAQPARPQSPTLRYDP